MTDTSPDLNENVFEELKRYVGFSEPDERSLRRLHPVAAPIFESIATTFYDRILAHEGARKALVGGESRVGQLKITLVRWMDELLAGPWDDAYFERRCRIGRVHVRIALPQHYMFGAMNVIRRELNLLVDREFPEVTTRNAVRVAVSKILDLELAIMLHTYREDLLTQQAKSERLSTFGQLVGSIGHELRNPLGVIETSLYILRGRPIAEDEKSLKHLTRIGEQVEVANRIITDLLDMIRDRPLSRSPVSLLSTWRAAVSSLKVPPGVRVEAKGLDALPDIDADDGQLRQVFVNLIENAVQAMGDAGAVTLDASLDAAGVSLAFEDTGPGVDAEIQKRLFEPLMTTKSRGVGLGLPLVKRIIERHGGSVAYAPRAGEGARFVVRLPLSSRK